MVELGVNRKKDKLVAVWSCDFCGKEFETKKESDRHEKTCKNRENEIVINWDIIIVGLLIIGLVLFFVARGGNKTVMYIEPTPMPTPDLDPYITCSWGKSKNGEILCADKSLRKSECEDSVCCSLGNGTWSSMGKVECARLQAEINSKKPVYVRQPVKVDLRQMQPPNVSCNFDLAGNWVCRPSY